MTLVKTKKPCCQSSPRCKRCPVVFKRLEKAGLVERVNKRTYLVESEIAKRDLRAARRGK